MSILGSPAAMRMEPPLDPPEDYDCDEQGHVPKFVKESADGFVSLYRCIHCGKETLE